MSEALLLTLQLALITTGILLLMGIPLAYWLAHSKRQWKPLIEATVALPLVLPPTVLGFYLLLFMGDKGWLGRIWQTLFHHPLAFTFQGLVIASILYSLPFTVQPLQVAFQKIEPELMEAAWTSGASWWQTFLHIVLPNSVQGLLSAIVLSFAHTLGEFGVVLMVGGNIPGQTRTLSIALYDWVEAMDFTRAGKLALLLLVVAYGVLAIVSLLNRKALSQIP